MGRRRVVGVLGGVMLIGIVAVGWAGVDREVAHLRTLGGGSLDAVECLPMVERREVALEAGGLTIRGDLYPATPAAEAPSRRATPSPGVVLLHGSSVHGRRLPLYPALAHELSLAGYTVLAIDLRGFGESDDPAVLDEAGSWDFSADAIVAVDSLLAWAPVDTSRIYIVGHSFGAGPGLAAAQRDQRIDKVVMIGPTRRLGERFLRPGAPDSAYYVERWQHDMRLPAQVPFDVMAAVLRPHNIENYANGTYRSRVPVLLTDGELEDQKDLDSLRAVADRMTPPAAYWTTPATDHYLHTTRLLLEPHRWAPERLARTACYNADVMRGFVAVLDGWLTAGGTPDAISAAI